MKKYYKCKTCDNLFDEDYEGDECKTCFEFKNALSLVVNHSTERMYIVYGTEDKGMNRLGTINAEGECSFLDSHTAVDYYDSWIDGGKIVSPAEVIWKGCTYALVDYTLKRIYEDGTTTNIYDFDTTIANDACSDDNLQRMRSGKIILF